jgi:hypothetical protein
MQSIKLILLLGIPFFFMGFHSSESDLTVESDLISPDTIILPKTDSNYVVKVLKPGIYDLSDIEYDANTMHWFALVSNGVIFEIKKIQPEQKKIKDESGNEKWEVKGHDSLNTIMMFSGVELLEKEVIEMKLGNKSFKVGDRLELNYNGKKYVVMADGEEKKDKSTRKNYIEGYELYIAPQKKEKNRSLLLYHKRVDELYPKIIWMGDLDNDKKPDLIINNTNSENENHITLYLSNNPPKGRLYKVMGVFNFKK